MDSYIYVSGDYEGTHYDYYILERERTGSKNKEIRYGSDQDDESDERCESDDHKR
ncbi:hypothetical protein PFDG_05141, partial [Plasmodium falciparum Dd2]